MVVVLARRQRRGQRRGRGGRGRRRPLLQRRLQRHGIEDGFLRRDLLDAGRVRAERQWLYIIVLLFVLLFG